LPPWKRDRRTPRLSWSIARLQGVLWKHDHIRNKSHVEVAIARLDVGYFDLPHFNNLLECDDTGNVLPTSPVPLDMV
jgi:hypothetical protein